MGEKGMASPLWSQTAARPPRRFSQHDQPLPRVPDADACEHASNVELKQVKLANTLAIVFETPFRQRVSCMRSSF